MIFFNFSCLVLKICFISYLNSWTLWSLEIFILFDRWSWIFPFFFGSCQFLCFKFFYFLFISSLNCCFCHTLWFGSLFNFTDECSMIWENLISIWQSNNMLNLFLCFIGSTFCLYIVFIFFNSITSSKLEQVSTFIICCIINCLGFHNLCFIE